MSSLPKGWSPALLDDVMSKVIGGGTPSRNISDYFDGEIPWFTVKDLKSLRPNNAQEHISQKAVDNSATNVIPANTLIVATRIALGKAIKPTVSCAINQDLKAIVFHSGIDVEFMLYWVLANERSIQKMGSGTTVLGIRLEQLHSLPLLLPPTGEQTRIVTKLEELLSDLDAGVAELKAAQKKLAQYRQSLLKAAVDGSLTAEWRKNNPPTETGAELLERILKGRRACWEEKQLTKFKEQGKIPTKEWQNKYPEPVQPDSAGLPKLPKSWVWASAEQLCEFITKGTTPPKELDSNGAKVIPFLRVTNLTDTGTLDLADKVFVSEQTHHGFLARSAVYPKDVLMNIVGPPLGQVSVVPSTYDEWNINQAIAIFRAVEGVEPWLVCRYLLSPNAQTWLTARSKTTAGQTNLTLEVCRNLPIPLAPQLEQDQLLIALETALSSISQQQETIEVSLKQAAAQRQNILRAAFAGQLVPQDPNDEPASVLLDRIRAERTGQAIPKARGRKKITS